MRLTILHHIRRDRPSIGVRRRKKSRPSSLTSSSTALLIILACLSPWKPNSIASAQPAVAQNARGQACRPSETNGCPDYRQVVTLPPSWHAPPAKPNGLVSTRRVFAQTINHNVVVVWFAPSGARGSAEVLHQALAITHALENGLKNTDRMIVARAFWKMGDSMAIDNYILIRTTSGSWRRVLSAEVANDMIVTNL